MLLVTVRGAGHTIEPWLSRMWFAMSVSAVGACLALSGTDSLGRWQIVLRRTTLLLQLGMDEVPVLNPAGVSGTEDGRAEQREAKRKASGLPQPRPPALWQVHLRGE